MLRSRARGQAGDQRPEELALARAGRSGHEHVRSVPHEIDLHRTVGSQRQSRAERRIVARGAPLGSDLVGIVERTGEQVGERDGGREALAASWPLGIVETGQRPGHAARGRQ